jgi:hypothetical protein
MNIRKLAARSLATWGLSCRVLWSSKQGWVLSQKVTLFEDAAQIQYVNQERCKFFFSHALRLWHASFVSSSHHQLSADYKANKEKAAKMTPLHSNVSKSRTKHVEKAKSGMQTSKMYCYLIIWSRPLLVAFNISRPRTFWSPLVHHM